MRSSSQLGFAILALVLSSTCAFGESFNWTAVTGGTVNYTGSGNVTGTGLTFNINLNGGAHTATCTSCSFVFNGVQQGGVQVGSSISTTSFNTGTFTLSGSLDGGATTGSIFSFTLGNVTFDPSVGIQGTKRGTAVNFGTDASTNGEVVVPFAISSTKLATALGLDPLTTFQVNSSLTSLAGPGTGSYSAYSSYTSGNGGFTFTLTSGVANGVNLASFLDFDVTVSPEPVSCLLFGSGLIAALLFRKSLRKA